MTTSLPAAGNDAACLARPVYLYLADTLPPRPALLKVGQSRDPRARQRAGLILPETPARSRLLTLIRVPDPCTAAREECDLNATMQRDHPHLCLPQPGCYRVAALEALCDLLDAIAQHYGRDG